MMPNFGLRAFRLLIRFSIAIALTLSVMQPALAAKNSSDDAYLWRYHYYGVLGKNSKISMILGSLRGNNLVGSYRYLKIGTPISLAGKIAPDGSFDLVEKTIIDQGTKKTEKITGKLTGRIDASFHTIQGIWSSPDSKKTFSFKLIRAILFDSESTENLPYNVGILLDVPDIALGSINSFCDLVGDTLDDRRTKKACNLTNSSNVGYFEGNEYRLIEFEELGTWRDGSPFKDSYSVLLEIINTNVRPFWLYKVRDDGSSLDEIKLLREGAYPVFEATYYSGGTMPSWHTYTIRRPSGFSNIDTQNLEHAVFKIAKVNGYETRSTLYYDFIKHQASKGFYKPKDGNCCPTAEISLTFDIVNDVMVLKDYKIKLDLRQ